MSEKTQTSASPIAQPQPDAEPAMSLQESALARNEIGSLLNGNPPSGSALAAYGSWHPVVEELHTSYRTGGTTQVRETFNALVKADSALSRLLSQDAEFPPAPRPAAEQSVKAPPLPDYAELTPAQEVEAQKAGQWLDDYVTFASKASPLTPKSFHVAAGLAALSLAVARRLYVAVSTSSNHIWSNLYLLFVGPSTRPRKTTAMRVLRGMLHKAGMEHFLLADRQTPEALALDLTTRVPNNFDSWDQQERERWLRERAIAAQRGWLLDEASHLLDSFNRDYSSGLLPMVLDLYDSSDKGPSRNTIGRGRESVERPYMSIFGCSTYGAVTSHVQNRTHWDNGLWARFAFITTDTDGKWKFWPPPLNYPEKLLSQLRFIAFKLLPMPKARVETRKVLSEDNEGQQEVKVVVVDPPLTSSSVVVEREAYEQWERYSQAVTWDMLQEGTSQVPEQFFASYGRLGTMLIKVGLLLAVTDVKELPVVIKACHVYRAQTIVETWRENIHGILGKVGETSANDDSQELARRIGAFLAEQGQEWTSRRDVFRKVGKTWSVVSPIMDDLEASGEIERRQHKPERGKATEQYRLILPDLEEEVS